MKLRVNKNTRTGEKSANPGVVGNYFAVRDAVGRIYVPIISPEAPSSRAAILRLSPRRYFSTFAP